MKMMYFKNKKAGSRRAFLIDVTMRKATDEKSGKHIQEPIV